MLYGRINGIDNISEAEIVEIVFQPISATSWWTMFEHLENLSQAALPDRFCNHGTERPIL